MTVPERLAEAIDEIAQPNRPPQDEPQIQADPALRRPRWPRGTPGVAAEIIAVVVAVAAAVAKFWALGLPAVSAKLGFLADERTVRIAIAMVAGEQTSFERAKFCGEFVYFRRAAFGGDKATFKSAKFKCLRASFDAPAEWNDVEFDWDTLNVAGDSLPTIPRSITPRPWPPELAGDE